MKIDLSDYEEEYWEERAAIMQYDGNMTKTEAEQKAFEEVLKKRELKL